MSQSLVGASVSCSIPTAIKMQYWMWLRCQIWGSVLAVTAWHVSLMNAHHECIPIWGKMMYNDFQNMLETTPWCHEHFSYLYRGTDMGYDSTVSIATRYGLEGPRIKSWQGNVFHTRPGQPWSPPNLPHNGYRVFLGGKAAGAWRWPPTPYLALRLKKEYSYKSTPPLGLHGLF